MEIIEQLRKVRKGAMFIIEGPSGIGKGTICKEILKRDENIKWSVSATTRKPREGEVNGQDYFFLSDKEYDDLLKEDAFYEHVINQYGGKYGTLKSEVDSFINVGQDVLFDMEWQGARQMKTKAQENVVTIYLLPPSIKELKTRLVNRGTDSAEIVEQRMNIILEKISHWNEFDYVIVNVDLEDTIKKIQRIISGERMKRVRQVGLGKFVKELVKEVENS
ncbi:MAG: guanylate kinase [Alphaproteobacteria bacterium]